MTYKITTSNLHIEDSYLIEKRLFSRRLNSIKAIHPNSDVWKRSMKSLEREWAVHNALYSLGIEKERTRSVDLNYPQKWYVKFAYAVAGYILWPFIR